MSVPEELEGQVVQLTQHRQHRFFGKYRGVVKDVTDPDHRLRIKALVPAVYEDKLTPWAMPALPFAGRQHGLMLRPEVEDGVWIEFEAGDPSRPIWAGCFWADGQRPSSEVEHVRMLATTAGHKVAIDDDAGEIKLEHADGITLLTLKAGEITLAVGRCQLKITPEAIVLNDGMAKVTLAGASLVNDAFKLGG